MKYMTSPEGFQGIQGKGVMRLPLLLCLGFLGLLCIVNFAMYFTRMGLTPGSVEAYYLGSEADFTSPRTFGSMLEVLHMHLPMMSIVLLMLTHLFALSTYKKPAKSYLIGGIFIFALLNEGAGWLVRFVHPGFAWAKILGFLGFQALLAFMVYRLTMVLMFPERPMRAKEQDDDDDDDPSSPEEEKVVILHSRRVTRGKKIKISEQAENLLKKHWMRYKEGKAWGPEDEPPAWAAEELIAVGYAEEDGDELTLSPKGWDEARSFVRRHRLGERLLSEVLRVDEKALHDIGCKFEHSLQEGLVENICTMLGHPRACPHGSPIPEGSCCRENISRPRRLVMPLSEWETGEAGVVAYVNSKDSAVMNKLAAMGVLPGQAIKLLRKSPSFLFKMGESQFGIDAKLAGNIYVRVDSGAAKELS